MNDRTLKDLGWQDIMPRYACVPLSTIDAEWVNGYYISMPRLAIWPDGEDTKVYFHVFESFIDSFLNMFNLSSTKKDKETVWTTYFDLMKKEHPNKEVKLYLNNSCGHAVAIVDKNTTPLPADISSELYEWLKLEGYNVCDFSSEELRTEFALFSDRRIKVFRSKHGVYRIGGFVIIPHYSNTIKIYGALSHCTTQCVSLIRNKAVSINVDAKGRKPESVAKEVAEALVTVADADRSPFRKLIVERLKTSRKTIASVQECLKTNDVLTKMKMPMRATLMELHKTLDHYGIVCPNVPFINSTQFSAVRKIGDNILIENKSTRTKWLSTNPSHIDRLQLFHLLVDTISRWCFPEHSDLRKFQEYTGDFLFSMGDLEETNAQRLFAPAKQKPKRPVPKQDIIFDDDSDILSDFDSDKTDTISDTDDIQSDLGD